MSRIVDPCPYFQLTQSAATWNVITIQNRVTKCVLFGKK